MPRGSTSLSRRPRHPSRSTGPRSSSSSGDAISDRDNWRGLLADIERAATPRGRAGLGCFAIEGTRLHERALRADAPIEAVLVAESLSRQPSPREASLLADLGVAGCRVSHAPDEVLAGLTGGRAIGALVGLVRIEAPPKLDRLIAGGDATILVGVEIEDPGNVGALVRTALAAGAAGFVGTGLTDAHHPRAVRTSMGSLFKLPLLRYESAEPLIADLERLGAGTLAAVSSGGTPLRRIGSGAGATALFVGSEAFGLPESVRGAVGTQVTIPMPEGVDSFSVNAAAAIVLYELGRGG